MINLKAELKNKNKVIQQSTKKAPSRKGMGLPGNLKNAVGQLQEIIITERDDRKTVVCKCVCHRPEEYMGKQFQMRYPLYESEYKTEDERIEELIDALRILGDTTANLNLAGADKLAKRLEKEKPFFLLDTSESSFNGKMFTYYYPQRVTDNPTKAEELEEEDYFDDEEELEEEELEEEVEEEEEDDEEEDDEPSEDEEEEDEAPPEKGDVAFYKTSPRGKPKECEVTSVSKRNETVSLKELETGKKHTSVPWARLIWEE